MKETTINSKKTKGVLKRINGISKDPLECFGSHNTNKRITRDSIGYKTQKKLSGLKFRRYAYLIFKAISSYPRIVTIIGFKD